MQEKVAAFALELSGLVSSFPQYQNTRPFAAFGRHRMGMYGANPVMARGKMESEPEKDSYLDEGAAVAPARVISLFLLGLGAGLAGKGIVQTVMERWRLAPQKGTVPFTPDTFQKIKSENKDFVHEFNISEQYEGLSSLLLMGQYAPQLRKPIMAYIGTAIMGYAAGSFAQGAQEAWVRREETKIRARLINQMTDSFRQSIRIKNEFINQLREEARARILDILNRHQVPDAVRYVQDGFPIESAVSHQLSMFEPVHRTGQRPGVPRLLRFGQDNAADQPIGLSSLLNFQAGRGWHSALIQTGIVGFGAVTGLAIGAFQRLFMGNENSRVFPGQIRNYKTALMAASESITLHGFANLEKNFFVMLGFFALAGAAKLGKLFLDGLREIEVTRVNAKTERNYQDYNRLMQDTAYYKIAVTEATENGLRLLERDLMAFPYLKQDPAALKQRTDSILSVELKAAPPFWLMTPPVQLAIARG